MGKKRKQPDFQKTKLKVGRRIPKGANETNTSFQTRKINLQEQIKDTTGKTNLKELLSFMKSQDVKTKFDKLRALGKFILEKGDTLSMFFPEVLKELGLTLQESDPAIRSEAILVLGRCVDILTDSQFKSFVLPLTLYLNIMMTHISFPVRRDSLKLLDALLRSHATVLCKSFEIPYTLLNLISVKETSGRRGNRNKLVRKLHDVVYTSITADEWRMEVLKRMLTFFNGMAAEKNSSEAVSDDQNVVHWDAKEALYLPLYRGSGIKPAKLDYSLFFRSVNLEGSNSKQFKEFINELICILSAIMRGFPPAETLSEAKLKYVKVIAEILCRIGEWAIENGEFEEDLDPAKRLISICCQLLAEFPYQWRSLPKQDIENGECAELNLEICYFYCMCSRLSDNPEQFYLDQWEKIKLFLMGLFQVSGLTLSDKLISLCLKTTKVMIQCKNMDDSATQGMLVALLGTLETHRFSSAAKDLQIFFMKLSLDYDFKNLVPTPAMRGWFSNLLSGLFCMMASKNFVPGYLNYIKQVCSRRNFHFMQALNTIDSKKFIELLKYDDEDIQLTIIHLIVSLNEISADFLRDIAETIRCETFPLKIASRLIRMLHSRFSQSGVPPMDQMNFLKFLLNLACDGFLMYDPELDTNPLPLTDNIINFQQSFACACEIYPTSDFKRHQEIFEVCADCLPPYLSNEINGQCLMMFVRTVFSEIVRYPVHSVVGIMELFRRFGVLHQDMHAVEYLHNFIYSCLLYNSLVTNDVPEEHWTEYCVPAVQECLDHIEAVEVVIYLNSIVHTFQENQLYHTLRVFLFLMQRRCLDVVDKNMLFTLLAKLRRLEAYPKRQIFKKLLHTIYEYLTDYS